MDQVKIFIELSRLKKPIGYMLLFWPCSWGLTIAYDFTKEIQTYIYYLILFLIGSILMRSAGCIINDIADKEYDKKVFRTKDRPIASNKVSIKKGAMYALILCVLAFLILIQFNNTTVIFALGSMPLAFLYPLMKRYTYWPQLFLGVTFNYGLILGWTSMKPEITIIPILLYLGAILWTLGYDTIYGFQDIKDDEIIGLKSTSIKFKNSPKKFLFMTYILFISSLVILGIMLKLKFTFYILLTIPALHLLVFQVISLNKKDPENCLKLFKSNNFLGLMILINLIVGRLYL
jgi:4-hydroxybenzoate polyprenyltransferase